MATAPQHQDTLTELATFLVGEALCGMEIQQIQEINKLPQMTRVPQAPADVLGILGREDVFAAALWDLQGVTQFVDAGFAAYCNYDGGGSRFGDTSVGAATSNDETTSIYASVDEGRDNRMILVAVNKSTGTTSAEIAITHGLELTTGQVWLISGSSSTPTRGADIKSSSRNLFKLTMPASSVTTLVLTR